MGAMPKNRKHGGAAGHLIRRRMPKMGLYQRTDLASYDEFAVQMTVGRKKGVEVSAAERRFEKWAEQRKKEWTIL